MIGRRELNTTLKITDEISIIVKNKRINYPNITIYINVE